MRHLRLGLVLACLASSAWAEGFYSQLTPELRRKLGLEQLSAEQVAELNAAVENYRRQGEVVAAQQAAETAIAEYKKKEEPGVVSRALDIFKRKQAEEKQEAERITGVLQGRFNGWDGSTLFRLDNGQVWRQAAADRYFTKAKENVAVVIYKAGSGYHRLRILDDEGAWVTVKRVQ